MGSKPLKMFKVNSLSDVRDVDSLYCIKTSTDTEFTIVVTDAFGNIVNLKDLQTPSGIQGIASDDGTIEVTGSTFKNLRLSATLVNAINSALKDGDNISELVNDAGYLTSFTETDPIFQASEASLFVAGDKANLDNNTGDETTSSIQTKRPLKTVDGKSLEGTGNIEIDYNTVTNKPTSFPPSAHNHTVNQITDFPTFKTIENQSIIGIGNIDLNKSDVGLENVDNTSDLDKIISSATQNALNGKASILHATTHEVTGSDPINGENLSVNVLPPTANYIPFSPTLKGHLQGIDTALGDVVQTTAGITSRVFFTGDLITLGTGNFYLSNYGGKGTVAGVSPTPLINDDNQKKYFTQDIISVPFTLPVVAPAGVYSGNLSVRINNDNAQQRYTIEVYRTALDGTPLPSGVSGAPVGDLGVTVLSTLDSGLLNLVGGDISSINLSGYLTQEITFNVNERLRYRISAEKVGTTGGNITMEVFYGNNYNSYYDVPVIADTNSVLNRSTVIGTTTTNALDSLNTGKANLLTGNSFTGNQQITGNISATGLATISGNVVGGGFIKTGASATNLLVADGSDIPQSTFALASSVHNPVTIGTANGLSLSTQVLSLGLASSGVNGALSGTDWNTFNGKANANGSNASGTWGINISGNAATSSASNSLNPQSGTDANTFGTQASFRFGSNTAGSTNFPTTAGVFFESRRSGPSSSSVGTFQLYSNNLSSDELLYFRKVVSFSGTESWSSWRKIATLNSADRFLLGTTTDNLTDIAQFNGSAIATAWKVTGGLVTQYQTGTGTVVDFGTSVRGSALTGFTSGAGTVSATDNVLQAIQKLNGNDALKANISGQTFTGAISATQLNVSSLNTAPATATSTGTTGEIRVTATHIYVCTATNTWVRTALTTW